MPPEIIKQSDNACWCEHFSSANYFLSTVTSPWRRNHTSAVWVMERFIRSQQSLWIFLSIPVFYWNVLHHKCCRVSWLSDERQVLSHWYLSLSRAISISLTSSEGQIKLSDDDKTTHSWFFSFCNEVWSQDHSVGFITLSTKVICVMFLHTSENLFS